MSEIHWYTEEELKLILRNLPSDLHRLLVLITLSHGLRNSEALQLTGANVECGFVNKKRLKKSKPCNQPWVPHDDPELDETRLLKEAKVCVHCGCSKLNQKPCLEGKEHAWRELKATERLFIMYDGRPDFVYKKKSKKLGNSCRGRFGYYRMINRAAKKAGIPRHKRRVHTLKHTCGMIAADNGAQYAQEKLGHVSMSNTGVYIRIPQQRSNKAFATAMLRMGEILKEG